MNDMYYHRVDRPLPVRRRCHGADAVGTPRVTPVTRWPDGVRYARVAVVVGITLAAAARLTAQDAVPTGAATRVPAVPRDAARGGLGDATRATDSGGGASSLYDRYPWLPRLLGAQFTYIGQGLPPFHADYSGAHSLGNTGDYEGTHTYGVYVGARVSGRLQAYVDVEMARGSGVSHATGLAGLTDGDVIRQGSVDLTKGPYLARAYLRYLIPLAPETDTTARAQDQVPGPEPTTRLEIKLGVLALSDDFDLNRYANTTRYQFMNWGLWNNTAWDFAADTRGFTRAVIAGYVAPRWGLKVAVAQMPTFANGNVFDSELRHAYSVNAELTVRPEDNGTVVRLLSYDNRGRMGIYRDAIEIGAAHGTTPNIVADDAQGRAKYGFALNVEQPLADSGNTGVFLRLGWADGRTEDFVFTEADRQISGGIQLAGTAWHRSQDRLGIAAVANGLSQDHADYLAAGGVGFLLGDGRLNYGPEEIAEAYYRLEVPVLTFCQVSPDFQFIVHPGYNRDRGPARVLGIRVNLHY